MWFGSSRVPLEAKLKTVPMPPSMSTMPSRAVAPVRSDSAWNSSLISLRCLAIAFSRAARSWKVSARRAGPPTVRAYVVISPRSRPVLEIRATSSPVAASSSGVPSSEAANQRPAA